MEKNFGNRGKGRKRGALNKSTINARQRLKDLAAVHGGELVEEIARLTVKSLGGNLHSVLRARAKKLFADDLDRIREMQRSRCAYCGDRLKARDEEIDHIVPLSRGGANEPANLQILCKPCNRAKRDHDPVNFAQTLGLLI